MSLAERQARAIAAAMWPERDIELLPLGPGRWGLWVGDAVNPLGIAATDTADLAWVKIECYLRTQAEARMDDLAAEQTRLTAALGVQS